MTAPDEAVGVALPRPLLGGRSVVVTGAARGIGRAIAVELARHGGRVVVADLDRAGGEDTTAEIRGFEGEAVAVPTDVRDPADVVALVDGCRRHFGSVDVLVNNAGIVRPVTLRRMADDHWDTVVDVHLKGAWRTMRAASAVMREQGGGSIVNITSIVARTGGVAQAHYAAAKAGIIGLTKSAAKEWGRFGIRVNAVAPGLIRTPGAKEMGAPGWAERIAATPLGRAGEPVEVARAVLFLSGDLSSFVTGTVLDVTGGRDM
ncbi:3-oxoacyl-ACP reductase FabG [Pseudonocardia sp. NPDC049154]|uniref:3-oxoacyl-ACP reductase FabG n=1 Tax=Pseudonocardia sp. NPDC049154 TaxID=3155501 RepID=UPI00340FCBB3